MIQAARLLSRVMRQHIEDIPDAHRGFVLGMLQQFEVSEAAYDEASQQNSHKQVRAWVKRKAS